MANHILIFFIMGMMTAVCPQVVRPLYPITGTTTPPSDDGSSSRITLQRPFIYFGRTYNFIYVNQNGHLTFDTPWNSYTPQAFPLRGSRDLIAPFWTDLDNRGNGHVYYNQYTSGSVVQQATRDINTYFPTISFSANWVFVATWYEIAYYPTSGTRTTVQAVLISGGQHTFVMMNYGIIASTSRAVQAGYDTIGSAYYYTIPGSFSSAATGSNSNFRLSSNVHVPGRWVFRTDDGSRSCTFNNVAVAMGDSFWRDSTCAQRCTCTPSGLQCLSQPCSFAQVCRPSSFQYSCQTVPKGTCTVSGDPHYYTFDGRVFHFQGICTYVLAENCGAGRPFYRVEAKNEHRGSTWVSWTRHVKVFVYNETIELVKGHHGKAMVNGDFAALPLSLRNGTIQVYLSGFSSIVSSDFGLEVSFDTSFFVRVRLPYTFQNATCGLCGNFNNDTRDDFRTRQGEVVTSDLVFANSWQSLEDDEPGCEATCEGLECAGCTEHQTALYSNADHCGILGSSSGPFAACHQGLRPQPFVESCVFDLCVGGGYQPILCQALNAYASQCQQNGVQIPSWRRPGFCEIPCPANSHFENEGTGCPASCVNPNATQNCPLPAQESCICDAGFILSAGTCVPHANCGCSFEGRYYSSGETVILDNNCGRRCSCSYGRMTCHPYGCGPQESCRVEEGERRCRPNAYGRCWIRGKGSYRTFDGLAYQYPGACRLTLAKVMGASNHTHFMVTTEKVPRGHQGFAVLLKFEAQGTQVSIEMANASRVQVNGQQVRLPFSSSSRVQVYHSSIHSIIIRTSFDVTVQTVWPHFVRVTAPSVYSGSLGGLCGDFDGHAGDDFRAPDGTLVNSSVAFGDSWRDGSLAAHCVESLNNDSTTNFNSSEYCGIISAENGPFARCGSVVNLEQQVQVCVENLRASHDPSASLCEVLRDYALICQQKGVTLPDWRNATGCAQTCPANSHYELCGTTCPVTCPSLSFPFTCGTRCQEGCQCDNGLVLNGNQCVPPTSCGCHHNGRYWQAGEQFWGSEQCQSLCTCNGTTGLAHCVPGSCGPQESCRVVGGEFGCHSNPHGTCSASGDPHYITFDHRAYDFQGSCRYVLATLCNNNGSSGGLDPFSVEAKNEMLRGLPVSVTAEVFVNVWGHDLHISRERRGVVLVDGVSRHLPILLNGSVSVYASGSRLVVSTDFGLSVTYNGHSSVFISVPATYRGRMCGLCGNFNGNGSDDFRTPSGAAASSPDQFGAAWKVEGNYSCSDGCGSSCPQCGDDLPARAQCQVIRAPDGPFSFCHEEVDPAPYFNDCVFDVCVSGNSQDLLCRAVEAYVGACQSANVRIYPWRENTTCTLNCPANSHYQLCGTDCGHTCARSVDATCEQGCSEGCFCDEGFLMSGTSCVPMESCGCQYDGFYYNAGESFWTDGCSQRCKCHAPNDLRCTAASCSASQECTVLNGQLGCFDGMSTCTVWGDPHYITFDGALAHFQGTCSYVIAESAGRGGANGTRFQVVATNNHRGNNLVSFVSAVDIYLSDGLETSYIRIGPNKGVKVNGSEVSLPASTGGGARILSQGGYIVMDASDLVVQFDGRSTLLVRIGQHLQNRVTGMCGNFNNNPADDKVLPNGTLARNDNEFGHSWKSPTSQPGCGATDDENDGGLNDCTFMQEYRELCGIITNTSGPFSDCHHHFDPRPFFTSCVYDLCLYTPANGMLCSAVSAYERTCSVLGLDIPEWRPAVKCAVSDPCDLQDCSEHEWCGEKDGVYGCLCDEHHHRPNNDSYDSSITCVSSSATMSLSRCQIFEAGFHPDALHLRDPSCNGTVRDGRLLFSFDNNEQLCGTTLRSNGTHFVYENTVLGDVDPHDGIISRERSIRLHFSCEYSLTQALSMDVGINPVESIVNKRLPSGQGRYYLRMIPYEDPNFRLPLTRNRHIQMEIDQRLYIEVQTVGTDERQIATILDSCWATPLNNASDPVRWNLISHECPEPADGTVELVQNGVSTVARFSFRMFQFTNFSSIYLHCQVHLCLRSHGNCSAHCYPGYHRRVARDITPHDKSPISLGPLYFIPEQVRPSSAPGELASVLTLLLCLLSATSILNLCL